MPTRLDVAYYESQTSADLVQLKKRIKADRLNLSTQEALKWCDDFIASLELILRQRGHATD
jgi:hypothetical protein